MAEAAGADGTSLYNPGDIEAAGLSGKPISMFLIKKVGMFPDVSEALSLGHLGRGDKVREWCYSFIISTAKKGSVTITAA